MKKQDDCITSTSYNVILASSTSNENESNDDDTLASKKHVSPKRPRARQNIHTPARNLGYDLLAFAINRSDFLIHGKKQEQSFSKAFEVSFVPMKHLKLIEMVILG